MANLGEVISITAQYHDEWCVGRGYVNTGMKGVSVVRYQNVVTAEIKMVCGYLSSGGTSRSVDRYGSAEMDSSLYPPGLEFEVDDDGHIVDPVTGDVYDPITGLPIEGIITYPDGTQLTGDGRLILSEGRYTSYGLDFPYQEGAYLDPNTGYIYYPDGSVFKGDGTPRGLYVTKADGSITVRSDVTDNGDGTYSYENYTIFSDGTVTEGNNAWFPDGSKYIETDGSLGDKGNYWGSDGTCYTFYPGTGWVASTGGTVGNKLPYETGDGTVLYPNGDFDTSNGGGFENGNWSGGNLTLPPEYKPPVDPPVTDSNVVYEDDHTIRYEDGTIYNKDDGSSIHIDDGGNVYQKNPDNTWESIPIQEDQPISQDKPLQNGNGSVTVPGDNGGTVTLDPEGNNKPNTKPPIPDNKPNVGEGSGGTGDLTGVLGEINKTLKEQRDILNLSHNMVYGDGVPKEGSLGDYQKKNYGYRNEVEFGETKLREHIDSEGKVIPIYSGYKRNIVASKVAEKNIEQHKDVLGENQSNMDIADNYEFEQQKIDAKENIENTSVEDVGVPEELDDYKVHRDIGAQFFSTEESKVPDVPLEQ